MAGLLGRHPVSALTVLAVGGSDCQTHLLFECAVEETAHRVCLPAGGFAWSLQRCAVGPSEQGQNLGRLGPIVQSIEGE
jgi:hypothetical protein